MAKLFSRLFLEFDFVKNFNYVINLEQFSAGINHSKQVVNALEKKIFFGTGATFAYTGEKQKISFSRDERSETISDVPL